MTDGYIGNGATRVDWQCDMIRVLKWLLLVRVNDLLQDGTFKPVNLTAVRSDTYAGLHRSFTWLTNEQLVL